MHRADCPNAADLLKHPERMIDVAWESEIEASVYQVEIYVEAIDRLRLLQDIVMTLADAGVNIISSSTNTHKDEIVEMRFLFEVGETERIGSIINSIKAIDGVFDATRMMPSANDRPKSKKKGKRS